MVENKAEIGNLDGIVVSKESLLDALKQNKIKHDNIYENALKAYDENVQKYVFEYRDFLGSVSKEYDTASVLPEKQYSEWDKQGQFSFRWDGVQSKVPHAPIRPESYSDQYQIAVRRIELSVYDTFKLSENEFQSYILNNWAWKSKFLSNSIGLLSDKCYYTGYYDKSLTLSGYIAQF